MGVIFSTDGPVLSARRIWTRLPPVAGTIASMNTSMPMPPTQWVNERQKSIHFDSASTLLKTLAPVVVKPDTVSKNASTKCGISPLSQNGRQPIRLTAIHDIATMTKPSRAYIF